MNTKEIYKKQTGNNPSDNQTDYCEWLEKQIKLSDESRFNLSYLTKEETDAILSDIRHILNKVNLEEEEIFKRVSIINKIELAENHEICNNCGGDFFITTIDGSKKCNNCGKLKI